MTVMLLLTLLFLAEVAHTALPPDVDRNTMQIIAAAGYPAEEHDIITEDGFILTAHRIPHGRSGTTGGRPVFLQPGIMCSSVFFVLNDKVALPYFLADNGFDVWIVNSRNRPGLPRHVSLKPTDPRMWAWSFDEMARFDVPAAAKYILNTTAQSTLAAFIGHSQGGTIGWAAFSTYPEVASMFDIFVPLAGPFAPPPASVSSPRSGSSSLLCVDCTDDWPGCCAGMLGVQENETLTVDACYAAPHLCADVMCEFVGCEHPLTWPLDRLPVLLAHYPTVTSRQNFLHWEQLDKGAQMFDYGSAAANLAHYNSSVPPAYRISNLHIPVAIFYGSKDRLCSLADVKSYLPLIPKDKIVLEAEFACGHMEFVFADDAATLLYPKILSVLKKTL